MGADWRKKLPRWNMVRMMQRQKKRPLIFVNVVISSCRNSAKKEKVGRRCFNYFFLCPLVAVRMLNQYEKKEHVPTRRESFSTILGEAIFFRRNDL